MPVILLAQNAVNSSRIRLTSLHLACENREIDPVERVVRPEYEALFRRANQRLIERVRPPAS